MVCLRLCALCLGLALAVAPVAASAGARIAAPATLDAGEAFTVELAEAPAGSRVELWGPLDGEPGRLVGSFAVLDGSAVLTAPAAPGSYELRLVTEAGAVAAQAGIEVAAVPVTLALGEGLRIGTPAAVDWRGPGAPGDMIQLYDPVAGRVLAEAPAAGAPFRPNRTTLDGPERPGAYELRYWSGAAGMALRRLPVTAIQRGAWLATPIEVRAGARFAVEWHGLPGADGAYRLVDPATDAVLGEAPARARGAGTAPAQLRAPDRPGAYRLRYVDRASGEVLADLPLEVDPR